MISEEAKIYIINLAYQKPTEYSYATEMEIWTRITLADHVKKYAPKEGHDCLKKSGKATIQRVFDEHPEKNRAKGKGYRG